jgi:hypothetical protein
MDRITKREFKGNWLFFSLLCLTIIGIPAAILYLIESTIEIEYEMDDAEAFLEYHYRKKRQI